jgi:hypothetical protein
MSLGTGPQTAEGKSAFYLVRVHSCIRNNEILSPLLRNIAPQLESGVFYDVCADMLWAIPDGCCSHPRLEGGIKIQRSTLCVTWPPVSGG